LTSPQHLLISPQHLHDWLEGDRPAVVLDVRWRLGGSPGHHDYLAGHLPGAVFVDLEDDICGPPGAGGRHPLPDPGKLQAVLRRAGVKHGEPVVVYDGGDQMAAARTWWTLRWAGLVQVRVLDGGFPAWSAAGLPTATEVPARRPGDVTVRPGGMPVLDAAGAAAFGADGRLVDVRAPERYRGESEPIDPVAGRIPGAVNLPGAEVGPDGRFAPVGQLRRRYAEAGLTPRRAVGAYCGSGVTAARTVLGMTLAGLDPVLYVGSWSEWITDPARPVARGPES
jgi:thiosulfate/3-mercaptopyruvate sulfurtransferase